MAQEQVNLRLDPRLIARIDAERGDVPRNRWIVRAVERALDGEVSLVVRSSREAARSGSNPETRASRPAPAEQPTYHERRLAAKMGDPEYRAAFEAAAAEQPRKRKATVSPPEPVAEAPAAPQDPTEAACSIWREQIPTQWAVCRSCGLPRVEHPSRTEAFRKAGR